MKLPRLNVANPLVVYTTVWLLVLGLTSLQLTINLLPPNPSTLLLVWSNIASFWLLYLLLWPAYSQRGRTTTREISPQVMLRLTRFVKRLLVLWVIGITVTIVYERGLPLLWALQGSGLTYADFGIPTFHGVLNSIYFFSVTALFLDYLVRRTKNSLYLTLLLLGWPVLAFARSVLLGVVCQMVAVYLLLYRVSLKPLIKLAMLALIIVVAFGLIGDYRGTQSSLITLVDDRYQNTFQRLPSGFLWFYIYLTSPLSNVVANIDLVQPTYVPYYSIANLIPTVARNVIFPADFVRPDAFQLVVENLNVSTFYAGYLSDFGLAGSILTVALLQLLIVIVYFNAKRKAVWAIIAYAVFFQCLVFSVFYNLLSSQVYVMQIVLALYFGGTVKRLTRHPAITRPASGSTPTEYRQPALHSQ